MNPDTCQVVQSSMRALVASSPFPRVTPITVAPELEPGIHHWNRCAGWPMLIVSVNDPVIQWKEVETDPKWNQHGGLCWGAQDLHPIIWINPSIRAIRPPGAYSHEIGHALGFGHKDTDPRIVLASSPTGGGGVMGGESESNPGFDRSLLIQQGYRVENTITDPRAARNQARAARRAERDRRRAERRARRGR